MSPRKRKHSKAFHHIDNELEDDASRQEEETNGEEGKTIGVDKEREMWDSIREDHYEIVEQLPLTLHRQLSLMYQLDGQAHAFVGNLLPTLRKYIQRRTASPKRSQDQHALERFASMPLQTSLPNAFSVDDQNIHSSTTIIRASAKSFHNISNTSTSMAFPVERSKIPETTRELLSHIAWLSEELLRASQEKVNLAQASHDSVDRHIRLLDIAILEQEASLASKLQDKSGTLSPTSLGIPCWTPNTTTSFHSGYKHDIHNQEDEAGHEKKDYRYPEAVNVALKLNIPPTKDARQINTGEELYCYCDRVSFGEMIACDHSECAREWFHLGCVGLTEPPEGEWYCEDCRDEEI